MVVFNQSKDTVLPGSEPGLLEEQEIKYVKSNKPSITDTLRELVKIDEDVDLSFNIGKLTKKKESDGSKEESYLDKLKKISHVSTAGLIVRILELVKVLEESIVVLDPKEGSKIKLEILRMKEVAHRLGLCGNVVIGNKSFEAYSLGEEIRVVKNVIYCNKPTCPKCAVYISKQRIDKLEPILAKIIEEGKHNLFFVTFTLRHRNGAKFKTIKKALYKIMGGMIRTRWFDKSVEGYVKNLEVTEGDNGVHPHLHCVIALPKGIDAKEFEMKVEKYWQKRAKKEGRTCDWSKMGGNWFKPIKIEDLERVIHYFTAYKPPKQLKDYDIVDEVVSSKQKDKNLWNVSPRLYCEVYVESKGIRWYASSGIFKVSDEVEKEGVEEISSKSSKAEAKLLFEIKGSDWKQLYLGDRFLIRDMVANRLLSDEECIEGVKKILDSYVQTHSMF